MRPIVAKAMEPKRMIWTRIMVEVGRIFAERASPSRLALISQKPACPRWRMHGIQSRHLSRAVPIAEVPFISTP